MHLTTATKPTCGKVAWLPSAGKSNLDLNSDVESQRPILGYFCDLEQTRHAKKNIRIMSDEDHSNSSDICAA